jgi:hypothetical protein
MSFILRKITAKNIEVNSSLGEDYSLVLKDVNSEEFETVAKEFKLPEEIYGFITSEGGNKLHLLSNKEKAFVMTNQGATFANVSCRV